MDSKGEVRDHAIELEFLDIEKKRDLVKRVTEVATDVYKMEHIVILIREYKAENVGLKGQLITDQQEGK